MKILFSLLVICMFFSLEANSQSVYNNLQETSTELEKNLKFESSKPLTSAMSFRGWRDGWFVSPGVEKDTENPAEGMYALKMESQQSAAAFYYQSAGTIEGDSIIFSGKYRCQDASDATIIFKTEQLNRYMAPATDVQSFVITEQNGEDSTWNTFVVRSKMQEGTQGILFHLIAEGEIVLWIDDLEVFIDKRPLAKAAKLNFKALDDTEFDKGSGLELGTITPQMVENLNVLGRVWGFVGHYHPTATMGDVNMDYELFRILPLVASAKNTKERSKILNNWILSTFGKITETKDYTVKNPDLYSRIVNLDWINDKTDYSGDLQKTLNEICKAKRNKNFNYNLVSYRGSKRDVYMNPKKYYPDITWDDQGFRLLTLFKVWNDIEYGFPYTELMDKPWQEVLPDFIKPFATAESEEEYEKSLLALVAHIQDSHGNVYAGKKKLFSKLFLKKNGLPTQLVRTEKGEIVVSRPYLPELKQGDVILSIDGKDVNKLIDELKPYLIVSNEDVLFRNIKWYLLRTDFNSITIEVERDKVREELLVFDFGWDDSLKGNHKTPVDYDLKSKKIVYVDLGEVAPKEAGEIVKANMDSEGFIFDLRRYPKGYVFNAVNQYLLPDTTRFMWFTSSELDYPGNFVLYNKEITGKENNPDYFKGKVALLVNEETQSLGEMVAIALRFAPQSAVIGSRTAGADGNSAYSALPGNRMAGFTTIGAYYPDWGICQRSGVKIDIEVKPTLESITEGRDVLIEKAIEYIEKGNEE